MADIALKSTLAKRPIRDITAWDRLKVNRDWLGFWFMLPALGFLVLFLAYPLGLGIWMSFTDVRIGRGGAYIGAENYEWLLGTPGEWLDWLRKFLDGHAPISKLHREPALVDQEEFVLVLVLVPDERAVELDELHVLPVQLTHDLRVPMGSEQGELLRQVDLIHSFRLASARELPGSCRGST